MKKLYYILVAGIILLTACSNTNNSVNSPIEGEKANVEQPEQSETNNTEIIKGFTPYTEIADFIKEEKMFSALEYESDYDPEDDVEDWGPPTVDNISLITKSSDEKLYYFNSSVTNKPGFDFEVFTFDENDQAIPESTIYSPTLQKLAKVDGELSSSSMIVDNLLVRIFDFRPNTEEDLEKAIITVETCDITDILAGKKGEYDLEVVYEKTYTYYDLAGDFGEVINTSAGPVYVYPDKEEDNESYHVVSLNGNQAVKDTILQDPYYISDSTSDIMYIDFKNGHYFSKDFSNEALKRVEIESGEPLYDGADDKTLFIKEDMRNPEIYPANDHSFYLIDEEEIFVIDNDLELIDSVSYDSEEDYVYGHYYLGNNEFLIIDKYEYQRKDRRKISVSKYVF
ncbi:hypothetical protein [Lederbergia galactosidilytica]|uniref:Lipoprotein n=1 Tax=Lederbergia galactosidilytica TaxID=217031 RepID=A0A178A1G1_9BACI|nr:hypothetical protein [Lederbergia galactosidilytica]OAK73952.1 hypothetical protein ABB05_05880 [Lederbergia galactosidilytica]